MTFRTSSPRKSARQSFAIGAIVKIGFVANLLVVCAGKGGFVLLSTATGAGYVFRPHQGLERMEDHSARNVVRYAQLKGLNW